jgi:hypothetical protein
MKRTASMSSLGSASTLDIDFVKVKQRPSEDISSIEGNRLTIKKTTNMSSLEEIAEGQCAEMDLQWPMDFSTPSHFLHECFLCKRRLMLDQDIYMYM